MNEEENASNGSKNAISESSVQYGLKRKNTGKLQTLWFEEPGACDKKCSYCYACGGEKINYSKVMTWDNYVSILEEAKELGVDSIGIPGAGEPFYIDHKMIAKRDEIIARGGDLSEIPGYDHPYYYNNYELTMALLQKCQELGIYVTLFTTGEFMTPELAEKLLALPVEIMLKGNSLDPETQDKFVSNSKLGETGIITGYGEKRNDAIRILLAAGFADTETCMDAYGRESRMALVTSIMTTEDGEISNYDEMVQILEFCRSRNIIFDCDTVLKRGRGASCELCTNDQLIRAKLLELQAYDLEKYGRSWEISQSYVGTVCDRYMHHMYINQMGEIRPCIGAMDVKLGNIRAGVALEEAWNSPEEQIIRNRIYKGKCGEECANFAEGTCNSCVGRRAEDLTNEYLLREGHVKTRGCWNFRPKTADVLTEDVGAETAEKTSEDSAIIESDGKRER